MNIENHYLQNTKVSKHISLVLYMFIPFCLVDCINGYFSLSGHNLPISQIYKLSLILLMVIPLILDLYMLFLSLFITVLFLFQVNTHTVDIFYDISILSRTLLFVIAISFFKNFKKHINQKHVKLIEKIFIFNFLVVFINVISGLVGFGYTTYGNFAVSSGLGFGLKGYFFAGNELGALTIALYSIVRISLKKRYVLIILTNISFLICSLLIGTKTASLGLLILTVIDFYFMSKKSIVSFFVFSIITIISGSILTALFSDLFFSRVDELSFKYYQHGLLYIVFSGRTLFLSDLLDYISSNYSIFDFFFGLGPSFVNTILKTTEIDFFDLFIFNGVLWAIYIYIVYISLIVAVYRIKVQKHLAIYALVMLGVVSLLAGHILTSAMLLPFVALYYPYFYGKSQNYQ